MDVRFKRKPRLKIEGDPYVNIPSGVELRLAGSPGSAGQVLTSQGSGANPIWSNVRTVLERSVDELASIFQSSSYIDVLAGFLDGINEGLGAAILNSANLSASKAASIVNHANLSVSKAALIFSNTNLSPSKAYSILADTNLSANKTQSILYNMSFSSQLVSILTYGAGDLTVSANTSISGVNRYGTLTVNSGVTLTITGQPGVLIVKTLNNSGTIAKSASGAAGGTAGTTGCGPGGAGGGGLIIFTDSLGNGGLISADGAPGTSATTIAASAVGGKGGSGVFIRVGTDVAGTGGDGGNYQGGSKNPGGVNGGGGGGGPSTYYPGGAGDGSTYTSFSDYPSLADTLRKAIIDWVIVNVMGKSPTTTQSIPNAYGSGGGGGGGTDGDGAGGGGGGGGGELLTLCVTLNNTGTIRANGGNGGNGGTEGSYDGSGGGGGGGIVYVFYKSLVASGTLSASGGSAGTGDYVGTAGGAGTAKAVAV